MQIREVHLHPIATRRNTGLVSHHVILELRADDDLVGWGEMSDLGHLPLYMPDLADLQNTLEALLVNQDPTRISTLDARMLQAFPEQLYVYDIGSVIRCAVDMALHDLTARSLGAPVATLLGGRTRDCFPVCYPVFRITREEQVHSSLETVRKQRQNGFSAFRLYAGRRPDLDEQFCAKLREEHGDAVTLKSLDFSNILPWKEALAVTHRLLPYRPLMVESPALRNDYDGLAEFRRRCPLPVSEHAYALSQVLELVRHRAIDVLNVALVFVGGFQPALKACGIAQAAGIGCLIGTTQELSLGTAAQAQLGATVSNLEHISDCCGPCLYVDDLCAERIRYEDGNLVVPEGPGLGLQPSEEALASLLAPLASPAHASISSNLDRTVIAGEDDISARYGG